MALVKRRRTAPTRDSMPSATVVDVEYVVEEGVSGAWDETRTSQLVQAVVARELGDGGRYAVTLHLVGEATIHALNREHRQHDAPTDVLSFGLYEPGATDFPLPLGAAVALGDVVVSHPRVVAQAAEYGHTAERELAYLVAHGMLHILGYDHQDEEERLRMRSREEEALGPLGLTR